jgi:hypothetical protein
MTDWYGRPMWLRLPPEEFVAIVNHEGRSLMVCRELLVQDPQTMLDWVDETEPPEDPEAFGYEVWPGGLKPREGKEHLYYPDQEKPSDE